MEDNTNYTQSMPQNSNEAVSNGQKNVPKDGKKATKNIYFIVAAAIIIIAIIGYVLTLPTAPNASTNTFVYKQLSQKNFTTSNLYNVSKNVSATINSTKMINASYKGNIKLGLKAGSLDLSYELPLNVSFRKYYNDEAISINVQKSGNSGLFDQNLSYTYIKLNNTNYFCRIIGDNFTVNQSFVGKKVCTKENSISNNSSINPANVTAVVKKLGEYFKFYNNSAKVENCDNMKGYLFNSNYKLNYKVNNSLLTGLSNISANGRISTCFIPSESYMPAFMNFTLNSSTQNSSSLGSIGNIYLVMNLNETKLTNTIQKSAVDTLPAEVVNSSELNVKTTYPTYPINSSSSSSSFTGSGVFQGTSCIATSGALCTSPIATPGNFSAVLGQISGTNWANTTFAFVPNGSVMPSNVSNLFSYPTGSVMGVIENYSIANGSIYFTSEAASMKSGATEFVIFNASTNCLTSTTPSLGKCDTIPSTVGAKTSGEIWAIYTLPSSPGSAPYYAQELGTATIKIS